MSYCTCQGKRNDVEGAVDRLAPLCRSLPLSHKLWNMAKLCCLALSLSQIMALYFTVPQDAKNILQFQLTQLSHHVAGHRYSQILDRKCILYSTRFASFWNVGWNWHSRVTLSWSENSAHILTWLKTRHYNPLSQLDLPAKFSTDCKHTHTHIHTPWVHMPSIVWVPITLSVSGRDSISANPLCGALWFFRDIQSPLEAAHLRHRTIANAPIDSAGLWSGDGCELNTPGPLLSSSSLCGFTTRPLWWGTALRWVDQKLLRTFKCLVDQPFHIRQGVHMGCKQSKKWLGCLYGGTCHGAYPLRSALPNFHSTVNWHWVRYLNRASENIHMGERQIMEDNLRAIVCLGWGGKTPHRQNFTFLTKEHSHI